MKLYNFLQEEVFFGTLEPRDTSGILVPFSAFRNKAYYFNRPCTKTQAFVAKNLLEQKGYRVAVFRKVANTDHYIFSFAKTKKELNEMIDYQLYLNQRANTDQAKFKKDEALLVEATQKIMKG